MPPKLKITAVLLIAVAATIHLLNTGYRDWNSGADTAYVMALLGLFFAKEKINDERVQELKYKAVFLAFLAGWAAVGAARLVVYLQDRGAAPRTMSGFDTMFVMLLIAHGAFQFWRHQDGRPAK